MGEFLALRDIPSENRSQKVIYDKNQGSSYAGRGRPGGTGVPGTFAGKKRRQKEGVFLHLKKKKNDCFHHEKSKIIFSPGGDTPSLFPNPLCSLKVATLVSTIPHVP